MRPQHNPCHPEFGPADLNKIFSILNYWGPTPEGDPYARVAHVVLNFTHPQGVSVRSVKVRKWTLEQVVRRIGMMVVKRQKAANAALLAATSNEVPGTPSYIPRSSFAEPDIVAPMPVESDSSFRRRRRLRPATEQRVPTTEELAYASRGFTGTSPGVRDRSSPYEGLASHDFESGVGMGRSGHTLSDNGVGSDGGEGLIGVSRSSDDPVWLYDDPIFSVFRSLGSVDVEGRTPSLGRRDSSAWRSPRTRLEPHSPSSPCGLYGACGPCGVCGRGDTCGGCCLGGAGAFGSCGLPDLCGQSGHIVRVTQPGAPSSFSDAMEDHGVTTIWAMSLYACLIDTSMNAYLSSYVPPTGAVSGPGFGELDNISPFLGDFVSGDFEIASVP